MDKIVGNYDWKALCLPTMPFMSQKRTMQFFGKDDATPILVSAIMGLQHAFAMVGGLIVPPFVVMKFSVGFLDVELQQYAIAASLIISGLCTILNCVQIPIGRTGYVLGTGVLSVIGTSFTFLPIFESGIAMMKADGEDAKDAYGKMLGTVMICSLFEIVLSFIPRKALRKMFPPIVTGVAVMLIGVALTGTGMKYWGGGAVCADMNWKNHNSIIGGPFSREQRSFDAGLTGFGPLMTDVPKIPPIPGSVCGKGSRTCCEAGEVLLPFGSPELIGLGFSVFSMLIIIELFGSPILKNCNVIIALLFGYMVAGVSNYDGKSYVIPSGVEGSKIDAADWITFLWVNTFNIGVYGPAILPCLIAFIVTTLETIGDITATYDASGEPIDTEEFDKSIQGGLLSDGICSLFAALATGMPNTTFSQNNGVISLTKCASRRAGIACGCWLLFMGIIAKISGIISSIPDCVIGGMTTFLFCQVLVSGLAVLSKVDLGSRRNRVILGISLGFGVGVAMTPNIFNDMRDSPYSARFWPCFVDEKTGTGRDCDDVEKGLRNGIMMFLGTPYCIGSVLAMLMNLILPADMEVVTGDSVQETTSPDEGVPNKETEVNI
eukprot:TRINITY_DN17989_c0_g1_i4.p1 TRINITY_DN17989_c0_g1~~TRINITY_DN17989_c0_g1_i4.p1  ORF type:complete len:605 (-),score=111.75 TRINITY_DN17989_c0_g1_i4:47-1861(-)